MSLDALAARIRLWIGIKFTHVGLQGCVRHMQEEAGEVVEATDRMVNAAMHSDQKAMDDARVDLEDELSDMFMIWVHTCVKAGIDPVKVIPRKFAVVQTREWLEPDEFGVVRHKK